MQPWAGSNELVFLSNGWWQNENFHTSHQGLGHNAVRDNCSGFAHYSKLLLLLASLSSRRTTTFVQTFNARRYCCCILGTSQEEDSEIFPQYCSRAHKRYYENKTNIPSNNGRSRRLKSKEMEFLSFKKTENFLFSFFICCVTYGFMGKTKATIFAGIINLFY